MNEFKLSSVGSAALERMSSEGISEVGYTGKYDDLTQKPANATTEMAGLMSPSDKIRLLSLSQFVDLDNGKVYNIIGFKQENGEIVMEFEEVDLSKRYWIGRTGNWNDTANWSYESGGMPGAPVPTNENNVIFDASSFGENGQTVTVNVNSTCLNISFINVPYAVNFAIANDVTFTIKGSPTIPNYVTVTANATTSFIDLVGSGNINIATYIPCRLRINANALADTYKLANNFAGLNFRVDKGTFDTDGKDMSVGTLFSSLGGSNIAKYFFRSSNITWTENFTITGGGVTVDAGTSTIICNNAVTNKQFVGGSKTYYNLRSINANPHILNNNTFNDIFIAAGKTIKFNSGNTQTFNTMSGAGTAGNLITLIASTAGNPYTLAKAGGGTVILDYYSIKDCTATGGTFNATNSINVSGNTGINFI